MVFDGSTEDLGKVVDEEFCGEIEPIIDGNKKMVLEETCTVPCPGKKAIQINVVFQDWLVSLLLLVPQWATGNKILFMCFTDLTNPSNDQ